MSQNEVSRSVSLQFIFFPIVIDPRPLVIEEMIAFRQSSYRINEDETPITAVTLTCTDGSDGDVGVTLSFSNNIAIDKEDYRDSPLINDNRLKDDEKVHLALSEALGGATLGSITEATLMIMDNDNNNFSKTPAIQVSPEFLIDSNDPGFFGGLKSSVASLSDGGFVVISTTNSFSISGQRFDANGSPVGQRFNVNGDRSLNPISVASVATLADGGFVVTWNSASDRDPFDDDIYGRRYNGSGHEVGTLFRVNTLTDNEQSRSSVASLTDGGFVITWQTDAYRIHHTNQDRPYALETDNDIYGQRYDASGNAVGTEFRVNTTNVGNQEDAQVTNLNNGGFVVTWTSANLDGLDSDIYGQRYDASGNAVRTEFRVNTTTLGKQQGSAVATLIDGSFIVTWESPDINTDNNFETDIYGQRYDANGNAVGTEFLVNVNTDIFTQQYNPAVTSLSNGGFVITWGSCFGFDFSSTTIYTQQYDAGGNLVSSQFLVDPSAESSASVASLSNGGFVATWNDFKNIFGQVFRPVTNTGIFDIAHLTRSGFIAQVRVEPIEIGNLPLATLYDEIYYLNQNPDVAVAVSNGILDSGYSHFVTYGQFEGRNPSVLYNEAFYLAHNIDVANAVATGSFASGFQHYTMIGQDEGRSPSDLFNETAYRATNVDVADAITNGGLRSGFEHYLETNQSEQRNPSNFLYDEDYYLTQNPDVTLAVALNQFQDGFEHYTRYGQKEGRNPSNLFNETGYLGQNLDVAASVSSGLLSSGFEHYVLYGRFEGRDI